MKIDPWVYVGEGFTGKRTHHKFYIGTRGETDHLPAVKLISGDKWVKDRWAKFRTEQSDIPYYAMVRWSAHGGKYKPIYYSRYPENVIIWGRQELRSGNYNRRTLADYDLIGMEGYVAKMSSIRGIVAEHITDANKKGNVAKYADDLEHLGILTEELESALELVRAKHSETARKVASWME